MERTRVGPEQAQPDASRRFYFLGTGSSEGCPGLWCPCPDCVRLAELGGRNRRGFPCAFLEPDVLIDAPCDVPALARAVGIHLAEVRHVLITHSHADHLYPALFRRRYLAQGLGIRPAETRGEEFREAGGNRCEYRESLVWGVVSPVQVEIHTLHVYATAEACAKVLSALVDPSGERHRVALHAVEPFEEFRLGPQGPRVLAVPASHQVAGDEKALNYVIEAPAPEGVRTGASGLRVFYGLDGDIPPPETMEAIRGLRYDLVVLELGEGWLGGASRGGHLNIERLRRFVSIMRREGMVDAESLIAVSHISPHFTPDHDNLATILRRDGILATYDGMVVHLGSRGSM